MLEIVLKITLLPKMQFLYHLSTVVTIFYYYYLSNGCLV